MINEKEVIEGCIAGKEKYQKILYEHFSSTLMGICMRYAKNIMEAEDILHDAFIKILVKIDSFRGEGSLEAWVKQITVNTAINAYRKKVATGYGLDIDEMQDYIKDVKVVPSDRTTVELLLQFVRELPDGYRAAFNLYEIDGYSHKEIAEMLGCSPVTVRTQLHKAKLTLRKKIEEHLKNDLEVL